MTMILNVRESFLSYFSKSAFLSPEKDEKWKIKITNKIIEKIIFYEITIVKTIILYHINNVFDVLTIVSKTKMY